MQLGLPPQSKKRKKKSITDAKTLSGFLKVFGNKWVNILPCMNNDTPLGLSALVFTTLLSFLFFTPSLPIAFSLPGVQKWMPQLQISMRLVKREPETKTAAVFLKWGKPFSLGNNLWSYHPPTPTNATTSSCSFIVAPRLPVCFLCWKISRLQFSPMLIMSGIRPVATHIGNID